MSYEVRVPESLLLAPLPGWVKMIWVAIRSFQGRGDACYAKYEMIGERTIGESGKPTDKGQVSRAVSALIKAGFLERITGRALRCLDPSKVDQESTFNSAPKVDQESTKVDQESTKVDQESTPSKNQHRKPKKKTKKKVPKKSLPDGLTYDQVFDSWNAVASELGFPLLKSRTDKRKQTILKLAARLWPKMDEAYENMRRGSRWFREELRPGFDWVWNETNFTKIYEGNYLHDRNGSHSGPASGTRTNGSKRTTLEDDFDATFAEMLPDSKMG